MECKYMIAWVGYCKKPANEEGFCAKHAEILCSCGLKATAECYETLQFVCGYPTCDGNLCHSHRR